MLVADYGDALDDSTFQLAQIAFDKIRPLGIMYLPVQADHIVGGKPILCDHDGKTVFLIDKPDIPVHAPLIDDPAKRISGGTGSRALCAAPVGIIVRGIDIKSDKVQGLPDRLHIFLTGSIDSICPDRLSSKHGVHPPAVAHQTVSLLHTQAACLFNFFRGLILRHISAGGKCDTDFHGLPGILTHGFHGLCMSQHTISGQFGQRQIVVLEGCMDSLQIAIHDKASRLVHRDPPLDPVGQSFHHHLGIFPEQRDDPFGQPAALFADPHGHIPMEDGHQRLNPGSDQLVHQIGIEFQSLGIHLAFHGDYPGPTDGEAVGL